MSVKPVKKWESKSFLLPWVGSGVGEKNMFDWFVLEVFSANAGFFYIAQTVDSDELQTSLQISLPMFDSFLDLHPCITTYTQEK